MRNHYSIFSLFEKLRICDLSLPPFVIEVLSNAKRRNKAINFDIFQFYYLKGRIRRATYKLLATIMLAGELSYR